MQVATFKFATVRTRDHLPPAKRALRSVPGQVAQRRVRATSQGFDGSMRPINRVLSRARSRRGPCLHVGTADPPTDPSTRQPRPARIRNVGFFFPHTFRRCLGMWVPIFIKKKDSGEAWERTDGPKKSKKTRIHHVDSIPTRVKVIPGFPSSVNGRYEPLCMPMRG